MDQLKEAPAIQSLEPLSATGNMVYDTGVELRNTLPSTQPPLEKGIDVRDVVQRKCPWILEGVANP